MSGKRRSDFKTVEEWIEHNNRAKDIIDYLKSDEFWDDCPPDWTSFEDVHDYLAAKFRKKFRWVLKQTLCRFGRHSVFIKLRDIDPSKAVLPAHCKNCYAKGRYDVLADVFLADKERAT